MQGGDRRPNFCSYLHLADRIPQHHPLWPIRELVITALFALAPAFDKLYSLGGWPSIPPEHSLQALLLQAFFAVQLERPPMGLLDNNLLFRWFTAFAIDDGRVGRVRVVLLLAIAPLHG
jgi:transposase